MENEEETSPSGDELYLLMETVEIEVDEHFEFDYIIENNKVIIEPVEKTQDFPEFSTVTAKLIPKTETKEEIDSFNFDLGDNKKFSIVLLIFGILVLLRLTIRFFLQKSALHKIKRNNENENNQIACSSRISVNLSIIKLHQQSMNISTSTIDVVVFKKFYSKTQFLVDSIKNHCATLETTEEINNAKNIFEKTLDNLKKIILKIQQKNDFIQDENLIFIENFSNKTIENNIFYIQNLIELNKIKYNLKLCKNEINQHLVKNENNNLFQILKDCAEKALDLNNV
jgi:hypothetical protein